MSIQPRAVLGISAYYHDSASALLVDGKIVAAAQEERFTRKKHDQAFPVNAIEACLSKAGLSMGDIDIVAFYDKPFIKFERLLETYMATAPRGFRSFLMSMPLWLREKLFQKSLLLKELRELPGGKDLKGDQLWFAEHHYSHAASAFYPSPFEEAVVLTIDGVGEWATTTVGIGKGEKLALKKELHFPHSLGLLYSAVTYYIGFKVNSGEYKVMGLAPYGKPIYKDLMLKHLIDIKDDGTFWLDQKYFNYATGLTMTNREFEKLFGQPVRAPDKDPLTQFHMDMAASVQAVTEEVMLRLARGLAAEYKIPNLCLAGGVALNCVANGKLLRDGAFKNIWVQPAAGDAGGALGAAVAAWHDALAQSRQVDPRDSMKGAYLGPEFSDGEAAQRLTAAGAKFELLDHAQMMESAVQALVEGKAVGWMQGAMEFGPRALGNRSILGDPRSETMQKVLNLKVKYRESFRPFAPAVLAEEVGNWFEHDRESPYMLMVADVLPKHRREMTEEEEALFGIDKLNVKRSSVPAITHVDYSARLQTVHNHTNPRFHELISRFSEKTGCPMLVNTSFNVRGEPIVCTPEDAFRCFMGTEIEMLVVGNLVLHKSDQDAKLRANYETKFELD